MSISQLTFADRIHVLAVLSFLLLSGASSSRAAVFSLSGDWSNTTNPNGPWSYNQASNPLPLVVNWDAAGTALVGSNQPAWAPSDSAGNFLPALMKVNSSSASDFGPDPNKPGFANVNPGDIVVHTVDPFNGSPALGVANFLFTLPSGDTGRYQISGFVWDAGLFYGASRPQDWELLVNGSLQASGVLSGSISRSEAQTFSVFADLASGNTVDLELFEDPNAAAGFFVGTNLTIGSVSTATPEPSTWTLLGSAIGLLAFFNKRAVLPRANRR